MASKAQVPTGSISFQTQEQCARRAPQCPQLGGCSSTTGLARGSASSCHGQDCDTTFITRERDVESRAQSQPPAPRASGWQEPSTAGRCRQAGGTGSSVHPAAHGGLSARCFLGHPTETSGLVGNRSGALQAWDCRNELLADCLCPRGLCKELGGWLTAWERSHSKAEGNNIFQFRCGFHVAYAFFFFRQNGDGNFKWKKKVLK